ncbi:MAG TPA: type I DNA topoisomerase [Gammaproteobacteria bacterium]|nr:type I DNA topoisomerase [Gammaproteobacteria bacterium]
MSENLVIVESPAKAKTIEKFLGDGFLVLSSYGHIRDLPKKNAIDINNNFETNYEISNDKKKVIANLRKAVKKASMVWLASDEDREGEAIAWHLEEVLGLNEKNSRRIVFHEITRPAILEAIENPRRIDRNLVNGQQARRVLDRLIGFELSPVLWKKIQTGLSAGRVQSVAVRLIVDREREIDSFVAESSFRISAEFDAGDGAVLSARLPKDKVSLDDATAFLKSVAEASFILSDITMKPAKKSPRAPFTTSTLQQEASQRLGFSVKQTMVIAQRLYESGKITYMRTDSVNLSKLAVAQAKEVIGIEFGEKYIQTRAYKSKSAGAQEAHEAIRPTNFSVDKVAGERNEQRLYQLIWQRAIASQMADAKLERTTATVEISTVDETMQARGEVLIFDGFLKVYGNGENNERKMLPPLRTGQDLPRLLMQAQEVFSRPPARYTEASLVKKLEEMGIGRPSTYAPTISTIQNRGYVNKEEREGRERLVRVRVLNGTKLVNKDKTEITGAEKSKLFPTDIAGVVTDFLVKYFDEVIDFNFTARVEDEFDKIAAGDLKWQEMIAAFYWPFHKDVENSEDISRDEAMQARLLGIDPKSGRPVSVRIGRFGPYAQIGTSADEEKPVFAGLRPDQRMDKVLLQDVLPLFELPRVLGETPAGEEVMVSTGRFGSYVSFVDAEARDLLDKQAIKGIDIVKNNVSIEPEDPHVIKLEQALAFIKDKKKSDAEKEIQLFEGEAVQVLNGRWGPFITDGFKNAKIPKDREPESLTLDECKSILAKTTKQKKRLTQQFYGGGFILIKNPQGRPDVTIKVAENKLSKVAELVDELESSGKKIRLISARGAKAIRAAEKRGATAGKKKAVKKKAKKKKSVKKKSVKKKAVKKKAK